MPHLYFIEEFARWIGAVFLLYLGTDNPEAETESHRFVGGIDHRQLVRKLRQCR